MSAPKPRQWVKGSRIVRLVVTPESQRLLLALTRSPDGSPHWGGWKSVDDVIAHLVASAVDGVRRPGSWERQWLAPAFGEFEEP